MYRTRLLVLLLAAAASCAKVENPSGPTRTTSPPVTTPATPTPVGEVIQFRVQGSNLLSVVTIRHFDPLNGLTMVTTNTPYVADVRIPDATAFVSIDASSTGLTFSTLQVQIFQNGRLFREGISVGSVLFASASGTVRQ